MMVGRHTVTQRMRLAMVAAFFVVAPVAAGQTTQFVDTSGHASSLVSVEADVGLEVLDWGGTGPPMVLLAGLGNTAHVFDHFAHQFTDRFRVLGVTRRGFGASSHPASGYDLATRARDLLRVADHFKLNRVVLVGHSIAGDELTKFAATYPERISALVYLDAAYDRTRVRPLPQPTYPEPPAGAFASAENYMAYLARMWNWRAPEAELYNTRSVGSDGRVGEMKTAAETPAAIIRRIEAPDYGQVRAPALALYARPSVQHVYPYYEELDAESKARADAIIAESHSYQEGAIAGFRAGATNRDSLVLDGNHYLFFTNEAQVVQAVRAFLAKALSSRTQ
jgi:non-heme chloroperoxidase